MRTNQRAEYTGPVTHEGARAVRLTPLDELRRSVLSCLLWEDQFYEDGVDIATRISLLALDRRITIDQLCALAVVAREEAKLRHVPLLLMRQAVMRREDPRRVRNTLARIIQRPDELCEFLALYWRDKRCPLAHTVKRGLAQAFTKFDAYQLAKYNRDDVIKLRDVLFLCHAKPKDAEQAETWKKLIDGTLPAPDTWEVSLSAGKDKAATWERLLTERKLGGLALLRNLRNMREACVDEGLIKGAIHLLQPDRILPYRFIAAAKAVPGLEDELADAMFRCCENLPKLAGRTLLLVDISGSMDNALSMKSDLSRFDAAAGLAMLVRELGQCSIYAFNTNLHEIAPRRAFFALRDALRVHLGGGTYLGMALALLAELLKRGQLAPVDRLIVITDEQCWDDISRAPECRRYMINVGANKNGVGYGAKWTHLDGFSENTIRFIQELEASCLDGSDAARGEQRSRWIIR
jgi:60 kDa SS-A/Ro ribonucleoprotein